MKTSGIGGQAVMEGIMMKNGDNYAVAIRKPDKEIIVKQDVDHSYQRHEKIRKIPFVRGVFNFIDSLVLGMTTLTYSAEFYEEDEEPSKVDSMLEKIMGGFGEKFMMGVTVAMSIILAVAIFMVCPFLLAKLFESFIVSPMVLSLVEGLIRVGILLGYILLISRIDDIQRVFMYHGAEHKCINCIEHGMELNVENVMKSSREHKRCGTSFLLVVMLVSIIFFLFIRVDSTWLRLVLRVLLVPVIAGVSYEFIRLAGRSESKFVEILSKPGMLLQRLTTKEPDESMVEVAIKAVEAAFDWEAFLAEFSETEKKEVAEKLEKAAAKSEKTSKGNVAKTQTDVENKEEKNDKTEVKADEVKQEVLENVKEAKSEQAVGGAKSTEKASTKKSKKAARRAKRKVKASGMAEAAEKGAAETAELEATEGAKESVAESSKVQVKQEEKVETYVEMAQAAKESKLEETNTFEEAEPAKSNVEINLEKLGTDEKSEPEKVQTVEKSKLEETNVMEEAKPEMAQKAEESNSQESNVSVESKEEMANSEETTVSTESKLEMQQKIEKTQSDVMTETSKKAEETAAQTETSQVATNSDDMTIPEYAPRNKKSAEEISKEENTLIEDNKIKAPRLTSVDDSEPGVIKLTWDKVKKVSGYVVYRKAEDEVYKMYPDIKKNYFEDRDVEPRTTYYYRVRAYVIKNNKRVYGQLSPIESNGYNSRIKSKY